MLLLHVCRPSINSGTASFKSLGFDLGQKLSTIVTSFVPTSKKIILECQEGMVSNRRAVVFGFTARYQPPFNCTHTHADLRRNLPRRGDPGISQAHHLLIQITTLQLSLLPQALQRCLLLRRVFGDLMTFCSDLIHRSDAGKTDGFAMTTDRQTESLTQIREKMPLIRDLSGIRGASPCPFCINAGTVAGDDFYARMTGKPFGYNISISFRKQIKNAVAFQIADNRAVTLALAPGPIVDTHDPRSRIGLVHR